MSRNQIRGGYEEQRWKEKSKADVPSLAGAATASVPEAVINRIAGIRIAESNGQTYIPVAPEPSETIQSANQIAVPGQKTIWKPQSYGTASEAPAVKIEGKESEVDVTASQRSNVCLSKLFGDNLLENSAVDNSTYAWVQIRATFYPKFENEKSDQEIGTMMIEIVAEGLATLVARGCYECNFWLKKFCTLFYIYSCWCVCTWEDVL